MTLWVWAEETADKARADGHGRLAAALVRLPELAVLGDADRIAAELPEALRAAAEPGPPPWVAPYLRHWHLTARVVHRQEGTSALPEAVELARAAHASPGHCPPGACPSVTAAACYANVDGPGHTVERELLLTVASEHVRPGTPAHPPLVAAFADLLVDLGRPREALDHLDAQDQRVRSAPECLLARVRVLRRLDRDEEALAVLDRLDAEATVLCGPETAREEMRTRVRFEQARLLAWLARAGRRPVDAAAAALPPPEQAQARPSLRPLWAEAVEDLDAVGAAGNDWRLGVRLTGWVRHLERTGAHRPRAELALRAARLALRRGARWIALGMVAQAQAAAAHLRDDDELAADLAEVRGGVRALGVPVPPVPAPRLGSWLWTEQGRELDPERRADLVLAALEESPHDTVLLDDLGRLGRQLDFARSAAREQWARVRVRPADRDAALGLLESLLHSGDAEGVRELVRLLADTAADA
ncbi:hypothetical protein [Thermobifida cellulosilytica]|uniref:Uncharacterized protein n=1 Tax=Thermobifida cellulosilytica TB100 TaxID=665004 RepID=A0A147KHG3_THECS|nr:hypothetical protein [Thermobifida cellulosilytica]KUP96732.1 hypothetical protein AC529_10395 [Thermobifida cellulosilytica TB100]